MPTDYDVNLTPQYASQVRRHFVDRCHQRGIRGMTDKIARAMNNSVNDNKPITWLKLYREPAWSTKIYEMDLKGTKFYFIYDVRKQGFVTVITAEQMAERDSKTSSLHSKNKS